MMLPLLLMRRGEGEKGKVRKGHMKRAGGVEGRLKKGGEGRLQRGLQVYTLT